MIILRVWRARLPDTHEPSSWEKLSTALAPSLRPVIRPALETQATVLGIQPEGLSGGAEQLSLLENSGMPTIEGEVFTDGTSLFVLEITQPSSRRQLLQDYIYAYRTISRNPSTDEDAKEESRPLRLALYYIGPTLDHPQLQKVIDAVNAAFDVSLNPTPFEAERFNKLREEGRVPPTPPSANESEASRALINRHTRTLAMAIKTAGGLLISDLPKQLVQVQEADKKTAKIRKTLESTGLIDSEIVVVCKKSQAQIARVPTRDVLEMMSKQGVRCACGRPIAEERVEEAVTMTDLGRALLDGNRWLTLLLLEELQKVGVQVDQTLIEQQVGGDEMDCLAVISGELVFFELKDKDFNLGNAYPFGAKMGIIRPKHAIIFSTHRIGGDAREHFERLNPRSRTGGLERDRTEIYYIEGLANLPVELQKIASTVYTKDAVAILRRVLSLATVKAESVIGYLETVAFTTLVKPATENASADIEAAPQPGSG